MGAVCCWFNWSGWWESGKQDKTHENNIYIDCNLLRLKQIFFNLGQFRRKLKDAWFHGLLCVENIHFSGVMTTRLHSFHSRKVRRSLLLLWVKNLYFMRQIVVFLQLETVNLISRISRSINDDERATTSCFWLLKHLANKFYFNKEFNIL